MKVENILRITEWLFSPDGNRTTEDEKVEAINDAKKVFDRTLKRKKPLKNAFLACCL